MKIKNGDLVKDVVTGFEGVVTATTFYLNGCERVSVTPSVLKDGLPQAEQYFDAPQVVVVESQKVIIGLQENGGPRPPTASAKMPTR